MGKNTVDLVLGWHWAYQLGLIGVLALVGVYAFIAQTHSTAMLASRTNEATWTEHPLRTQFTALERRISVAAGGGFNDVHEIRLQRDGHDVGHFTVVTLYEGSFWRLGKADDLYVTENTQLRINEVLRSERFRALLRYAPEILCIGLASSRGQDRDGAERLSKQRADRLCDLLRQSGSFENVQLTSVPFGQALGPEPTDPVIERGQRVAVLIGLSREDRTLADDVLYAELLTRVRLNSVNLVNYSRVAELRGQAQGAD